MKTYSQVFSKLAELKRPALIPFFVIGDPDFETSFAIVKKTIDAGADILELGIAFSDPIVGIGDILMAGAGLEEPKEALDGRIVLTATHVDEGVIVGAVAVDGRRRRSDGVRIRDDRRGNILLRAL